MEAHGEYHMGKFVELPGHHMVVMRFNISPEAEVDEQNVHAVEASLNGFYANDNEVSNRIKRLQLSIQDKKYLIVVAFVGGLHVEAESVVKPVTEIVKNLYPVDVPFDHPPYLVRSIEPAAD